MIARRMSALPAPGRWEYLPQFAEEQLPRYTSYPPANRFTDQVDRFAADGALAALQPDANLSVYIHIPFCQKLCWYCGCHTSVPTAADPVDAYVAALIREIELVGARIHRSAHVSHIHFGGGSPDILTPEQIHTLFAALRDRFSLARFPEIAAELDPRSLRYEVVEAFVEEGLNRASIGVQTLDRSVQERINRIQSADDIARAIDLLRACSVTSVNADLMYGLPGQTVAHVVESAAFVAMQDVDRVAVFGYAHVPWIKKHQKSLPASDLPHSEQRFRQAEAAAKTLDRAGYLPVGFDHFAAPGDSLATASIQGRLRRNFQGYTDDDSTALIGFGSSAISSLPNLIYQNAPDTASYRNSLSEGRSPVVRGAVLSPDQIRTGKLIERLLCDSEANVPSDLLTSGVRNRLKPILDAGLAELSGTRLTVTSRGLPYVRNIAACFDAQFAPQPHRHSLAI